MDLWAVKYASRRSRIGGSGIFRVNHLSEAPGSGAFWPLTRVQAKGGLSAQGVEPDSKGVVVIYFGAS
jgi:hypothetical protein